jgi:hypothetical protein
MLRPALKRRELRVLLAKIVACTLLPALVRLDAAAVVRSTEFPCGKRRRPVVALGGLVGVPSRVKTIVGVRARALRSATRRSTVRLDSRDPRAHAERLGGGAELRVGYFFLFPVQHFVSTARGPRAKNDCRAAALGGVCRRPRPAVLRGAPSAAGRHSAAVSSAPIPVPTLLVFALTTIDAPENVLPPEEAHSVGVAKLET